MHVSNDDFNVYEDITTEDIEETIQALQGECQKANDRNAHVRGEINGLAHEILTHLKQMQQRGDSPKKIYSYAKMSLFELQTAKERFNATQRPFEAKIAAFDAECERLGEKLSRPLHLAPLPTLSELMANNSSFHKQPVWQSVVLPQPTASGLSSGSLAKAPQIPFTAMCMRLSPTLPKSVSNSIRHLYKSIESHPTAPIDDMIVRAEAQINKAVPRFEDLLGRPEERWFKSISQSKNISLQGACVEYLKQAKHLSVAKLTTAGADPLSIVVKESSAPHEIFKTLTSNHFLSSLKLSHMRLAEPLAVGLSDINKTAFLAKTFLPGKTFEELFATIKAQPLHTHERQTSFLQLYDAAHSAGCALGELQSKGVGRQASATLSQASMNMVQDFYAKVSQAEGLLADIGMPHNLKSSSFERIIQPFLKQPGELSYGFGEISPRQFVWDPRLKIPLGLINDEKVSKTFTTAGKSTSLAGRDPLAFMSLFNTAGFMANLAPQETSLLQETFSKGYSSNYRGLRSPTAEAFFDLYSALDTVENLACELTYGKNSHIEQILSKKLLPKFNKKYGTQASASENADRSFQEWHKKFDFKSFVANGITECQPILTGHESLAEMDRKILQSVMGDFVIMSKFNEVISAGIDYACSSTKLGEKACQVIGTAFDQSVDASFKVAKQTLPNMLQQKVQHAFEHLLALPPLWEKQYGVSQENTWQALEGTLFVMPFIGRAKLVNINKVGSTRKAIVRFLVEDSGAVPLLPKKPTTATSKKLIKIAKEIGYKEATGGKGSHTKMHKPGAPMVIIPLNSALPKGTLHSIWKVFEEAVKKSPLIAIPLLSSLTPSASSPTLISDEPSNFFHKEREAYFKHLASPNEANDFIVELEN